MNPKEKAKELFDRFLERRYTDEDAKECALICVDEILETLNNITPTTEETFESYWREVKQEIENL
tara:strand:+ start:167 stop:361 length:195 start_codon:yes stop_codon:yes gene_type:complete